MTTELLRAGLAKLGHGGWSLTIAGYARRTLKIKHDLTGREFIALRDMMNGLGLEHRRVPFGSAMIDVWDYQK